MRTALARMSSAVLTQVNGVADAFHSRVKRPMAADRRLMESVLIGSQAVSSPHQVSNRRSTDAQYDGCSTAIWYERFDRAMLLWSLVSKLHAVQRVCP